MKISLISQRNPHFREEGLHVEHLRELDAVVELHAAHRAPVVVEALQLQCEDPRQAVQAQSLERVHFRPAPVAHPPVVACVGIIRITTHTYKRILCLSLSLFLSHSHTRIQMLNSVQQERHLSAFQVQ